MTAERTHGPIRTVPAVAWIVILLCATFFAWRAFADKIDAENGAGDGDGAADTANAIDLDARILLAQRAAGIFPAPTVVRTQLDTMSSGRLRQRLRAAALAAELLGAEEGRTRITAARTYLDAALGDGRVLAPNDGRALETLEALYAPPGEGMDADAVLVERADAMDSATRAQLTETLGWPGTLAAVPEGAADATTRRQVLDSNEWRGYAVLVAGGGGCCIGLASLLAAGLALILTIAGKVTWHFAADSPLAGLLVEVFAAWMALMTIAPLVEWISPDAATPASVVALVVSPAALLWGRVRGVRWTELRRALGLHRGAGIIREMGSGIVAYLAGLPLLVAGVAISALLASMLEGGPLPTDGSHPITEALRDAGPGKFAFIIFVASVAAPLLEETFFRGALYAHLRGNTSGMPRALSVIASASLTGFIFAAVHPQSLVAIPALAALGVTFAIAREWRGSLIAPMTAHGLSNLLVLSLAWIALG